MTASDEAPRAEGVTPAPTLRVVDGALNGTVLRLDEQAGTLGRREDNTYVLADARVSRIHARIVREGGSMVVTDLGSSGGTLVNEEPVVGSAVINHGDRITFASVTTVFEDPRQMTVVEEETEGFEVPEEAMGPALSPRQEQVLELIADGLTNAEIGERLGITERTVKAYTTELYNKLDVPNRAGAVAEGLRHGLL